MQQSQVPDQPQRLTAAASGGSRGSYAPSRGGRRALSFDGQMEASA